MNINIVRDLHVSKTMAQVIHAGLQGIIDDDDKNGGFWPVAVIEEVKETCEQLENILSSFPETE